MPLPGIVVARCTSLILIIMLMLAGCSCQRQRQTQDRPYRDLVVAIDRSGSTSGVRLQFCQAFYDLVDQATTKKYRLSLWAFDSKPVLLWGPRVPEGTEKFNQLVDREFVRSPNRRMTRPALVLEEIASQLSDTTNSTLICVLTDGDSEISTDRVLLEAASKKLASMPHVSILSVIGIKPENKPAWHSAFECMETEFRMAGIDEAEQEITELCRAF